MENRNQDQIKITVIGSGGQLGQEFQYIAKSFQNISFSFYGRDKIDITNVESIFSCLSESQPNYIINCIAYTEVDKAEAEKDACFAVNKQGCSNLMEAIKGKNIRLVHFSTDYVYHHFTRFPLLETDEKHPKSNYALSKLEGEDIIRNSAIESLIIRTSWVVSSFGHNFVKTMMRLCNEKDSINVVNDQFGAPTYARHLALAVIEIIQKVENNKSLSPKFNDTYNYANEGLITWYDLAKSIINYIGSDCIVHPIPSSDYLTPAQRPNWSLLSKHKIKENFNLEIPHWITAIKECIDATKSS